MESESLLREIKETVEENNKILRGIRRNGRIRSIFHIFYWLIIVGVSIGAYYYVQPYVNELAKAYAQIKETQQKISNVSATFPDLSKYLK